MICFFAGLKLSLQIPTIWQSVSSTYSLAFCYARSLRGCKRLGFKYLYDVLPEK
jgi:hypothetical protein